MKTVNGIENAVITLPIKGNYQPARESTHGFMQFDVQGPFEWAVETDWSCIGKADLSYIHGPWDESDAKRFARSMGNGARSKAVKVEPYFWSASWGVVPAAAIHAYDHDAQCTRLAPPAACQVLGTGAAAR